MKQPFYVHTRWLVVLFVIEIVYVLTEFAFNAALLNAASGLVRDDQALHRIEVAGRILSGVGLSILMYWAYFRKKLVEESVETGLKTFAKSLIICVPLMYVGQKIVVDSFLVNGTTGQQRQYAETLILMKTGIQNGIVKMANLEFSKGGSDPSEMAFVSVMGAILLGVPEYATAISKNEEAIARRVNQITSSETADKTYPLYYNASKDIIDGYKEYSKASKEYMSRVNDAVDTSKIWSNVERSTSNGYAKYVKARNYYQSMSNERFVQKFGYPKGIRSLTEFRRTLRTIELINLDLSEAGLSLDVTWNGQQSSFSQSLTKKGSSEWNQEMGKHGLGGISPGLTFRAFEQSGTIQEQLKEHMQSFYRDGMRVGLSKDDFTEQVIMPKNEASIRQWIEKAKNRSIDLGDGGSREEEGRQFVRALIVPPIALILSLFFSLLTLAKLPLRAVSFVDKYKGDVPWVTKARKFIMAGDLVAILSLPLAKSDSKIMKSSIFELMSKKAKDAVPLGNVGIIWLIKGEPIIYKTGQAILEQFGLDQRDAKYKSP
jgi:hypothetical protein